MEKIEIIMDSTKIIKYFCCFSTQNCGFFQLFPNKEIITYMKFLKQYSNSDNMDLNSCLEIIFEHIKNNKDFSFNNELFVINDIEDMVFDEEFLIFEFPNNYPEEELFYFKLKFC